MLKVGEHRKKKKKKIGLYQLTIGDLKKMKENNPHY